MNRFNIVSGFALVVALSALSVGCFAPSGDGSTQVAQEEESSLRTGNAANPPDSASDNGVVNNVNIASNRSSKPNLGPQPDPWQGGSGGSSSDDGDDPDGPQPDPWHPRTRIAAPSANGANNN